MVTKTYFSLWSDTERWADFCFESVISTMFSAFGLLSCILDMQIFASRCHCRQSFTKNVSETYQWLSFYLTSSLCAWNVIFLKNLNFLLSHVLRLIFYTIFNFLQYFLTSIEHNSDRTYTRNPIVPVCIWAGNAVVPVLLLGLLARSKCVVTIF